MRFHFPFMRYAFALSVAWLPKCECSSYLALGRRRQARNQTHCDNIEGLYKDIQRCTKI